MHLYHFDPNIFPEPETFRPERWLVSEEASKELEKNMMPFSRGSRMCTGIKYVSCSTKPSISANYAFPLYLLPAPIYLGEQDG